MSILQDNSAISIYIFFSIIVIMVSFLMGLYKGNLVPSLIRLLIQIIWVIIVCIILFYIQKIQYGNILVWIIVLLAILLSISEVAGSLLIFN